MSGGFQKRRVLITVMTYPHPSEKHDELVCTAGITQDNEWVRLYPIDYRHRPREQQFHKYQWIEVELDTRGVGNDNRKESRKPNLDSIKIIGPRLSSTDGWRERREIIDSLPHHTVNELKELFETDRISLGIVRPKKVLDIEIRKASTEWKAGWKQIYNQMRLFGPPPKPLKKLPYTFHYIFECDDSVKPSTAMIEDWELGVLFLNEVDRLGSDSKAAESIRRKYLDELCSPKKDTRFFMGTLFPYNTWLVLGVFWPPKIAQGMLF